MWLLQVRLDAIDVVTVTSATCHHWFCDCYRCDMLPLMSWLLQVRYVPIDVVTVAGKTCRHRCPDCCRCEWKAPRSGSRRRNPRGTSTNKTEGFRSWSVLGNRAPSLKIERYVDIDSRQGVPYFDDGIFQSIFGCESFESKFKFRWNSLLVVQLTTNQYWLRWCLGAEQATIH